MSSENELDSLTFQKRKVNPRRAAKSNQLLSQRTHEDEKEHRLEALDEGHESDSTVSSDFSGTDDGGSLIGEEGDPLDSSPPTDLPNMPTMTPFTNSPKKPKPASTPTLQALPPPRPISFILPVSELTKALQAKEQKPSNPTQRFATWNAAIENQGKIDPITRIARAAHPPFVRASHRPRPSDRTRAIRTRQTLHRAHPPSH